MNKHGKETKGPVSQTSFFLSGVSLLINISRMGIMNAKVFPLPVTWKHKSKISSFLFFSSTGTIIQLEKKLIFFSFFLPTMKHALLLMGRYTIGRPYINGNKKPPTAFDSL